MAIKIVLTLLIQQPQHIHTPLAAIVKYLIEYSHIYIQKYYMKITNQFLLVFSILLLSLYELRGQSFGIVKDSATNAPLPFVNIWIKGEPLGTTSNENGEFSFNIDLTGKKVVFSSIGYKTKEIVITRNQETVLLETEIIQLKEVVIRSNKLRSKLISEKFKTTDVRLFFFCDGMPYMKARYFPYKDEYSKTPFISKVDIVTNSYIENATFNLRLYTIPAEGSPIQSVYSENIIVSVKKGRNLTSIDLTEKLIEFPITGLLVAFEYLIVKQNEYMLSYNIPPDTSKLKKIVYAPSVGSMPADSNQNSWIYKDGIWQKDNRNTDVKQRLYKNRFDQLAIGVTLTN
jgi:hypothetical protein